MFHDCKLLPRVAPTDEARVSQTTNTVQLEEAAEEQTSKPIVIQASSKL
jgi:hypothetical protein